MRIFYDVTSSNRHYIACFSCKQIYILLEKQVLTCISIFQTTGVEENEKRLSYHTQLNSVCFRQSWTKPLRPFQLI
jgi:hypothetical protein